MARTAIPRAKKVIIASEPAKKENLEQVIPDSTKRAAMHIGYGKLMGTGKGHNKSAREKAYSSLYRLLDHRQRVLIMQMKVKNKKIKKTENPEPAYVNPRPNGDYLVERILNSRRRQGLLQYQMLWEGFPLEMASWEPIRLIDGDISTLIENFYKEFPGKPGDPAKGHNEYLEQLEEEKKTQVEKNADSDADSEAELTVEVTPRRKTKKINADSEVESDAEGSAGAITAFEAEDDEDGIPISAVGDRGPKCGKARMASLFDANRPVGLGGAAAQAMQLIPASPRSKKKAAASTPATRKSSRNATQKYGSLNDKALSQGKVKPNPNILPEYFTSNDNNDEEIPVPSPAYPVGLVSMASLITNPRVTAGSSVQTAADLFSSDFDDGEEVEVSQTPFRSNRGTTRAHGGKEKSANKKPRDDIDSSESSDYDLTTSPVAANSPVPVRKKPKMTSTQERKAQEAAAGKKVIGSHMVDDLFGEALEESSDESEYEECEEE